MHQGPTTPTLEAPNEQDEELEDEDGARDPESPNKRGSTGNESSESDTTLQTPKLTSRAVSPQIQDDPLHQAMMRSPYAQSRSGDFRSSTRSEQLRLLRPLSLSQGLSGYAYGSASPRYSWSSSPSNGMAYERSPKAERFPKRQSMPFDSKPLRSVQSLEIDLSLLQKTVADREAQLRQREAEIQYLKRSLEKSSAFTNGSPLNSDEVIERLREDHSNEIQKMFKEHKLAMEDLEQTHKQTFKSVSEELTKAKEEHARELEELHSSHKVKMEEFETRQKTESGEAAELRTALDAAWEEVAATGRRQEAERNTLTSEHHQKVAELEERHAAVLAALQGELAATANSLKSVREEVAAATAAKERAEKDLANRPDVKDLIPLEEHNIVVQAMEEMEKALTAAEDEKRQLKINADQVKFELSKIRDEHEMQRSGDLNRLAELEKRCSTLSADNATLQQQVERNRDSKASIIEPRSSRTKLPPIGPPPTAPLPPLPAGREAIMSPTLTNSSLPRMSHHEGSIESARSSRYDHDSHDGHHPRSASHASMVRPDSIATNAEVERDRAYAEREEALRQISETEERLLELKSQLDTEQRNNEAFTKDLIELRKTNSKLKVRVDDVNRELTELKRERDSLRRDVVEMKNELADAQYERIADRQRLEGARNEVLQYKAQLERAVDRKVNKRSDQKLKASLLHRSQLTAVLLI
jgi:kinesin family protein 4/21/27